MTPSHAELVELVERACAAYDKWVRENINTDHSNKAWPEAMRRALEAKWNP